MSTSLTFKSSPVIAFMTMAAGSDPEPMESSRAGESVTNCHQTARVPSIFTNIRHIPYLDHNYGQPPPMTPPDSNSPAPEDVDTGNEEEEDDGVTRCICGFDHDDGYMICCDKCSVWQHLVCMGISSTAVPETYLCEQCHPRQLDKDQAKIIQARKREEMSDDDDDDEGECESEDDKNVPTYTAVSNTPTRITLTAKISQLKRKQARTKTKLEGHDKNVRRKKHLRQKPKTEEFIPSIDEETSEPWETSSNYGNIDRYEEIKENIYGKELEEIVLDWKENDVGYFTTDVNEQLCKVAEVQGDRKGIVATEDMNKNQFIIEFKGKLMLQCKFESENPFFRRCSPYVLYYAKLDHMGLCIDARRLGNDARFVRRSCSPTAQVKHFIHKSKVHLGIYSLCPLPKGSEITIAFEFGFDEYNCYLDCACAQDSCAIAKNNAKYQTSQCEMPASKRLRTKGNDDSNSSHKGKLSPLRSSFGSHSNQGDSDSDLENNPDTSLSQSVSRRKKLTREERKLEAYLKQIEKMEKKEKRNKDKEHKQVPRTSCEDTSGETKLQPKHFGSRRLGSKRRLLGPTPSGQKNKRARLSSGSSEPLSPEEHSSTVSTPTTPKVMAQKSEEEMVTTPSASPSRSFKFPKGNSKMSCEEESKEVLVKSTRKEAGEQSGTSSPSSPGTPREGDMEGLPVLSTASSITDLTVDETADETANISTSKPTDCSTVISIDTSIVTTPAMTSLKERLSEISDSISSDRDSPSPCSSTSGSPTCAESVMNSCNGPTEDADLVSESSGPRQQPVPAPGSSIASAIHGTKLTRSNPFYGSLKKRWLLQFLYGQNVLSDRVPNGFKTNVNGTSLSKTSKRKSQTRTPTAVFSDPLPLKKRHLKKYQASSDDQSCTLSQHRECRDFNTPVKHSSRNGVVMYSPVTPENKLCNESASHLWQFNDERINNITADEQVASAGETKPLSLNFNQPSALKSLDWHSSDGQNVSLAQSCDVGTVLRIDTSSSSVAAEHLFEQKPRDLQVTITSPEGTPLTSPASAREHGLSTPSSLSGLLQPSVITVAQSSIESPSGTPGKKKVSLLEYRNRSRQRLSSDGPKPSASDSQSPVSPSPVSVVSSTPLSLVAASPVKSVLSSSVPNLSTMSASCSGQKSADCCPDSNGPSFEPVSPDVESKRGKGQKQTGISLERISSVKSDVTFPLVEGNAELRRELQRKHEIISKKEEGISLLNERLGAFITEALKKDSKLKSSQSPGSSSSLSDSPAPPPPPPPPPDVPGDAMEIEEDESNAGSGKIYVNTPVGSTASLQLRGQPLVQNSSRPHPQRQPQPMTPVQAHSQPLPQSQLSPQPRGTLLAAYPGAQSQKPPVIAGQGTPEYRNQLQRVSQPIYASLAKQPQHASQSQLPYLITSHPGSNPSIVRFPSRVYQPSSGQSSNYFPQ